MKYLYTLLLAPLLAAADYTVPIERYTLPNGLRVILSKDNAVPVVTVYMIYNVGSRSEEKGRTGFAHLFEHMMFEGSANEQAVDSALAGIGPHAQPGDHRRKPQEPERGGEAGAALKLRQPAVCD